MKGQDFKVILVARPPRRRAIAIDPTDGFTLVELMVTTAIIALLMILMVAIVNQTSSTWAYTTSKIEQFQGAREGFEAMTRRISQATLNTYWDYDNPNTPTTYLRQSELRFISGLGLSGTSNSTPPRPTHSIFFYAPLGFVTPSGQSYSACNNLLNLWGYYIEYASDSASIPSFATSSERTRLRLMELSQPSQALNLYELESQAGGNSQYKNKTWFLNALNPPSGIAPSAHILAENVIALVMLPRLTPGDINGGNYTPASLAPTYLYDSTGTGMSTSSDPKLDPINQLPPVVQVTMVAIDEPSAIRIGDQGTINLNNELESQFANATQFASDLGAVPPTASTSLVGYLQAHRVRYRIFTSDISIKGAKWSANQKN